MKRILSLLLVLLLLCSSALAEGKLKITEKNLILLAGDDTAYFCAKVENVGDAPIGTDSGDLVIFTADDDILYSSSFVTTMPSYCILAPGDFLYVYDFIWNSALKNADIGDIKFSMKGTARKDGLVHKLPCEAKLSVTGGDVYGSDVFVTVTNDTDAPVDELYIACAVYDAQGQLMLTAENSYTSFALHPGSTLTIEMSIDSDIMTYYGEAGFRDATASAYVCFTD